MRPEPGSFWVAPEGTNKPLMVCGTFDTMTMILSVSKNTCFYAHTNNFENGWFVPWEENL